MNSNRFKEYILELELIGFVLMMIVAFGGVSYVGYLDAQKMKQRLDSVYETNLLPIVKLNSILDIYNDQVALSILKAKEEEISYIDASEILSAARYDVMRDWENYKFEYEKSEKEYVKITEIQLNKTNNYLLRLIEIYQKDKSSYIDKLSNQNFFESLHQVKEILRKIIKYEVQSAQFQQKLADKRYDKMVQNVLLALLTLSLVVFMFTYVLIKKIHLRTQKIKMLNRKFDLANTQLRDASIKDSLTGLYNKKYFDEVMVREINRANREKAPIALFVVEVDFFREYNDTYGHNMGDNILRNIGKVIKEKLQRASDYLFRIDSEEFAVFLYNVASKDAVFMAELIRKEIEDTHMPHDGSKVSKYVTVSIGVNAVTPIHKIEVSEFFNIASDKLTQAKNNGLNHVHY